MALSILACRTDYFDPWSSRPAQPPSGGTLRVDVTLACVPMSLSQKEDRGDDQGRASNCADDYARDGAC